MNKFTKQISFILLCLLFNSFIVFSQQTNGNTTIRSSIISFSDIVKNSLEHQDVNKKFIGNDYGREKEEAGEEILPTYEVYNTTNVIKDPFGKIVSTTGKGTEAIFSPSPSVTFNALDDNGTSIPPDVNGAVGPSHIMTTLNTQVRIQNLTGAVISTVSLNAFWASLGNPSCFDPKILYEPFNNRWIFSAVANAQAASSALLIGVSQTNNPTGLWNLYLIDADATNTNWLDYPSMGYNKDWVVVTGNLFSISGNIFASGQVNVIKKADLYNHVAVPAFTRLTSGATLAPTATFDNSLATMYLLQRVNGNSGGSGFMNLYNITGAVGSEVLNGPIQFSTPNPWNGSGSATNSAPQSGTTTKIANNDDRVQNAVYRNGSIWGVHTVFLPAGAPTRSAVQWWQISPAGAIIQRGRIDDATSTVFCAFPSIAVNSNSDVLIGYSRFSATTFASSAYAMRLSTEPVNTLQSEFIYKAGLGAYVKTFGGTSNRWGDYTATMTDPTGLDFWTVQEYASTPSGVTDPGRWGTWWAKIPGTPCLPANPVSVSIAANPSGPICLGSSVTFTATPTNPGTTPSYQWINSGVNVGTNSSTYTVSSLTNGNQISCVLTSNISCATGNPATSNVITMTVNTVDDFNACTNDVCNTATGTVTHNPISVDDGNACTTDACANSITSSTVTTSGATGLPITWTSTTPSVPSFDLATLNVTGFPAGSQITNISSNVNLNHTWGGDMELILEHPNAVNFVEFVNDPTDSQMQFGSSSGTVSQTYSFTSTGSTMTILANPNTVNPIPFPGPYKPVNGSGVVTTFATFNTLNPNGIWKFYVGDGVSGDGGTVSLLSLTITANSATAVITHTPVSTNDGNACTTDGCNTATGIFHTPVSTDDGNACTSDACNSSTGSITHTAVNVDDSNICTTDACNTSTGAITHTAVNTNDGNACTTDGCNTSTGVFHNPVNIDDGNACTMDGCDSSTGLIGHIPVSVDDGNACTTDACNTQTGAITHTPTGCGVTFTSRIYLEGFYIGGGFMNNLLYVYNQSLPVPDPLITSNMSDYVTISAMDDIPFSHALVDSKIGILKTNGDVTVTFGPSVIANNNYYIKVNHRNHVETWSTAAIQLTPSTTYNFHTAQSQAYGSNQALTFDAANAAMFTGDINQDGSVDGTDFLDFDGPNQVGAGGYEAADLNGDGGVDGSDFLVYDPNSQNGVGVSVPIP